ncbi:substrate-binding domain-containing protein [Nesterenkonia halophila]|uniref:LacI family DNA-binding transcriptional regulator n=1 Tax=Nesterenkonia halophila TaxID=302044 RepID=UPI0012918CEC|nr:substrate-binding domain-containing protein [Nesterenkonia halophila]
MRESVHDRRGRIVEVVHRRGVVRVADLASLLAVSMVTVRRDVEALARTGRISRRHGVVGPPQEGAADSRIGDSGLGTVAVVAPARHPYLDEVTQGCRRHLELAGFRVVLHVAPHVPGAERQLVERLPPGSLDGLLLAPRWHHRDDEQDDLPFLASLDLPTVLLERRVPASRTVPSVDSVTSDHGHGVRLAVEHLTGLGHRRILLAARDDSPTARTIRATFSVICAEHPAVDHHRTVLSSPDAAPPGEPDAALDLSEPNHLRALLRDDGFTAILVHSDENALVITQRLSLSGLQIPEDCAIVAYDDVVAGLGSIPLTAVAPPKHDVGREAAEVLVRRMRAHQDDQPWTTRHVEMLPSLAVRSST